MDFVRERKGSVGAEHGMGVFNPPYLSYSKSDTMIKVMKNIKRDMDPNGIMNPFKIFE